MNDKNREDRMHQEHFRRRGSVAACAVLLVANQFVPALMAGDVVCYSVSDVNCDWIVDGEDLAYLLGNWGTNVRAYDLDGSCNVDGGDVNVLLGNWGVLQDPPELEPIEFENESVSFCTDTDPVNAVLNGYVYPDARTGMQSGNVEIMLNNSVHASIQYQDAQTVIMTGTSKIAFDGSDSSSIIYVNGVPYDTGDLFDDMLEDIETNGLNPDYWQPYTQAMMAHTMVHQTTAVAMNMMAAQVNAQNNEPDFWCKAAAYAAATAITVLVAGGCIALETVCAAGTVVTFGGIAIPCTALLALCVGGVYAGAAAAYELALHYWAN